MTTLLDATTVPFSLSVLTATKGHASKRLVPDANGKPVRDPGHTLGISAGRVEHVQVAGLNGLRDLLQRVTQKQALVHGIPKGSNLGDVFQLLRAEKYSGAPRTIARTLDCIDYPPGVRLIMLDYDPEPDAPGAIANALALITQLSEIWPAFADVGWLATTSTSSAIRCKVQDNWLRPPEGMHVYLLVTGDVTRFREIAKVRLWLAGYGFCKLATPNIQTGVAAVLERTIVDLTVFSPERLDFVAGALIAKNAPFYQDCPAPELHAGSVLDLDALPNVTDDERAQYATLVTEAKDRLTPERRAKVREVVKAARAGHVHSSPMEAEAEIDREVTARLALAERGELTPEHTLYFPNGITITADGLNGPEGKKLDGKRLADPQEPTYRQGDDAVFHWRRGDWRIVSWAHGVQTTYQLLQPKPGPPVPDDKDFTDLVSRIQDGADYDDLMKQVVKVGPYQLFPWGLFMESDKVDKVTKEPLLVPLTNFGARITGEVTRDDGSGELVKVFEITATLDNKTVRCTVPAKDFSSMSWVTQELGARAILTAGAKLRDCAREAIQRVSEQIMYRHVYLHTGWLTSNGERYYLHGRGAITALDARDDINVELPGLLARYQLPAPPSGESRTTAITASLALRDVLLNHGMVPVLGMVYLAPLRAVLDAEPPDFTVWILGSSGMFKTELATLAQGHWGDFSRMTLPASFTSTGNALERLCFATKDALLTVDDYHPAHDRRQKDAMDQAAQRLLRGVGNGAGRARMRHDTTLKPDLPPRGVTLATGERLPDGHSTNARVFLLSLTPTPQDDIAVRLTKAQERKAQYPLAMAAYIQWIAQQWERLQAIVPQRFRELRQVAYTPGSHSRQASQIAYLQLAWEVFTGFAVEAGALDAPTQATLLLEAWSVLTATACQQSTLLQAQAPEQRFLALLADGFASKRCYLENMHGDCPADGDAWGWVRITRHDRDGNELHELQRPPQGTLLGHAGEDWLYLFPEQAYQFVSKAARDGNSVFPVELNTLLKHLDDRGMIATAIEAGQRRRTVQQRIGTGKPRVIKLNTTTLTGLSPGLQGTNQGQGTTQGTAQPIDSNIYYANKKPSVPYVPWIWGLEGRMRARETHVDIHHNINTQMVDDSPLRDPLLFTGDIGDTGDPPQLNGANTGERAVPWNENSRGHTGDTGDTRAPITVLDWCYLLSAGGVQQNATPYQVQVIAPGPDGRLYARFAETTTGWLLAHCEQTTSPAATPIASSPPDALPSPRPDPGGTQACPQCGRPLRLAVGGKGVYCTGCRYMARVAS